MYLYAIQRFRLLDRWSHSTVTSRNEVHFTILDVRLWGLEMLVLPPPVELWGILAVFRAYAKRTGTGILGKFASGLRLSIALCTLYCKPTEEETSQHHRR